MKREYKIKDIKATLKLILDKKEGIDYETFEMEICARYHCSMRLAKEYLKQAKHEMGLSGRENHELPDIGKLE